MKSSFQVSPSLCRFAGLPPRASSSAGGHPSASRSCGILRGGGQVVSALGIAGGGHWGEEVGTGVRTSQRHERALNAYV